jgi:hypothetical protein
MGQWQKTSPPEEQNKELTALKERTKEPSALLGQGNAASERFSTIEDLLNR